MSKTAEEKQAATEATDRAEIGPLMSGSDILVACLEREGVDTIFAYPGGASMVIHQSLTKSEKIRTILPRHEQGGGDRRDRERDQDEAEGGVGQKQPEAVLQQRTADLVDGRALGSHSATR